VSENLDMHGVQRDAALLDAVAARTGPVDADPAVLLLAALAADVDLQPVPLAEAVAVLTATGVLPAGDGEPTAVLLPEVTQVPRVNGHRRPAHGTTHGVVRTWTVGGSAGHRGGRRAPRAVAAMVSVVVAVMLASGVAVAVTGDDPLAPIRKVIRTVTGGPVVEPEMVGRTLDGAGAALDRGDTDSAEEMLDHAKRQLNELDPKDAQPLEEHLTRLLEKMTEQGATTPGATQTTAPTTEPTIGPSQGAGAKPPPEPAPTTEPPPEPAPTTEPPPEPAPTTEPPPEPQPSPSPGTEFWGGGSQTQDAVDQPSLDQPSLDQPSLDQPSLDQDFGDLATGLAPVAWGFVAHGPIPLRPCSGSVCPARFRKVSWISPLPVYPRSSPPSA